MTRFPNWVTRLALAGLAAGATVVACYNDVPGLQGPLPSPRREVSPLGPSPGPIMPSSPPLASDGGVPLPIQQVMKSSADPAADPSHVPQDAGIDSTADLPPEVPDSMPIVRDAAQPLRR